MQTDVVWKCSIFWQECGIQPSGAVPHVHQSLWHHGAAPHTDLGSVGCEVSSVNTDGSLEQAPSPCSDMHRAFLIAVRQMQLKFNLKFQHQMSQERTCRPSETVFGSPVEANDRRQNTVFDHFQAILLFI